MNFAEFIEWMKNENRRPKVKCQICSEPITNFADREVMEIPAGLVHVDCNYDALGDLVESHPIVHPRIRRG